MKPSTKNRLFASPPANNNNQAASSNYSSVIVHDSYNDPARGSRNEMKRSVGPASYSTQFPAGKLTVRNRMNESQNSQATSQVGRGAVTRRS